MSKEKAPLQFSAHKSYEDWKKLVNLWKGFTSLEMSKRATAVVLSLEGNQKALTSALEIPESDLSKADGVDILIKKVGQNLSQGCLDDKI